MARCTPSGSAPLASPDAVGTDVIYPIGHYYTWLCGPELEDAIARGRVDHWTDCIEYEMEPCLKRYGEAIYAMRLEADKVGDRDVSALAKRLLVSLPGKLGQRSRRWNDAPGVSTDVQYGEWCGGDAAGNPVRYRAIAGRVQRDTVGGWAADAVPAIAAWITSGARKRLAECIRAAGWPNVYYCDTDSLMVDAAGYSRLCGAGLVQKDVLGYLQVKSGPLRVELRGIKYYVEGSNVVCAGLPRGHMTDAGDGSHYWYSDAPVSQIRQGQRPQAGSVLREYRRDAQYRHGVVHEDGSVTPHVLEEW